MASKNLCIFHPCQGKKNDLITSKEDGIATIRSVSLDKDDRIHELLEDKSSIWCHKSCYCSYTSKSRNITYTPKKRKASVSSPYERVLKSMVPQFSREDFKSKCFICAKNCLPRDPKNPKRWKKWSVCENENLSNDTKSFKDTLLDVCDQRQDDWSQQVFVHLQAVATSLVAYDGRYHKLCYDTFVKVPKKSTDADSSKPLIDAPTAAVVSHIKSNKCFATWTIAELYEVHANASGELSKKQMFNDLSSYFGVELVIISVPGCETEVGLKKYVSKTLKMTKKAMAEDSDDIDNFVRRISSEVSSIQTPRDYNLSDFSYDKTVTDTSETLLKFISKLISKGKITKKSITLAQCIQQHIGSWHDSKRNQTILGLAVKLHHKTGSSELIRILHDHGITSSYDEVLRFRKSVASFVASNSTNYYEQSGLTTEIGQIFSWCDNYDLWISSPNGMKTTHAMVSEFTVHPKQDLTVIHSQIGVMSVTIPRLKKSEAAKLKLANKAGLEISHYSGAKKVNPPFFPEQEDSNLDKEQLRNSLDRAAQRDTGSSIN